MSEVKRDYEIGYGKPPPGRPFQKGHGKRRKITKRPKMYSM
jgi:hypothetical protein